ncbi:MAG: methyltransferase [Planctomycetota bacterium]
MKGRTTLEGIALARVDLVPGRLAVYAAEDPDALLENLTEEAFRASDERMPYFATLWPAGRALALVVMEGPLLAGLDVLDLGAGVGAVGLAALTRGARVTFLDWEPRALAIVRAAAADQGLEGATFRTADWRAPPPDLGRFDRVLAADVLYEARNVPAVASFLACHLAPGGEGWVADPRRTPAEAFPEALGEAGLVERGTQVLRAPPPGGQVVVHRVALAP